MKYYSLFIPIFAILFLLPASAAGQSDEPKSEELPEILSVIETYPVLLTRVTTGTAETNFSRAHDGIAIQRFIGRHFRYPRPDACLEGTMVVSFTITEQGVIDRQTIQCVRSFSPDCAVEAERIIHLMADLGWRWQPGTVMGQPVPIRFNVPIRLSLD